MTTDERVERSVEKVRSLWAVGVTLATLYTLFALPWWCLLPLLGVSIVTYYGSLLACGWYLGFALALEERIAKEAAEKIDAPVPVPVDPTKVPTTISLSTGDVVARSDVIGRFGDNPIYEWLDILQDGKTGATARYYYENPTLKDKAGNLLLPRKSGKACFNEITYGIGASPT